MALILLPVFAAAESLPQPGISIPPITLQNLYYETYVLKPAPDTSAHVLFFFSNTCPVARRYMARMSGISDRFEKDGVRVLGINASPADSVLDVAQHALDYNLSFPVYNDADFSAVRALGITRTPEVVILDKSFTLRYRGRIDDQYRLGGVRPVPSKNDLIDAIQALLAGGAVEKPLTRSEGCAVTYPMAPAVATPPTYNETIQPILRTHCTGCHATGGMAPIALDTLESAVEHREAIARAVTERRMPPWFAEGEECLVVSRALSASERHQLVVWSRKTHQEEAAESSRPNTKTEDSWTTLQPVGNTSDRQLPNQRRFMYQLPWHEEIWLSGLGVDAPFGQGIGHAEIFLDAGGAVGQGIRLTGPILPGQPLRLSPGEGIHVPADAKIAVVVHPRPDESLSTELRCNLLVEPTSAPVDFELRCKMLEESFADHADEPRALSVPFDSIGRPRAIVAWAPNRCAMTVHVSSGTGEEALVLSIPAFDPDWPLTYEFADTPSWQEGAESLIWRLRRPRYLGTTGANGSAGTSDRPSITLYFLEFSKIDQTRK